MLRGTRDACREIASRAEEGGTALRVTWDDGRTSNISKDTINLRRTINIPEDPSSGSTLSVLIRARNSRGKTRRRGAIAPRPTRDESATVTKVRLRHHSISRVHLTFLKFLNGARCFSPIKMEILMTLKWPTVKHWKKESRFQEILLKYKIKTA